jgi:hypothetical protein
MRSHGDGGDRRRRLQTVSTSMIGVRGGGLFEQPDRAFERRSGSESKPGRLVRRTIPMSVWETAAGTRRPQGWETRPGSGFGPKTRSRGDYWSANDHAWTRKMISALSMHSSRGRLLGHRRRAQRASRWRSSFGRGVERTAGSRHQPLDERVVASVGALACRGAKASR